MVQEVRIPVKADVGHGVAGVGKVEDAFDAAAAAAGDIGKSVGDAGRQIDETTRKAKRLGDELKVSAERLKEVRDILQRDLGAAVSESDAMRFLQNFQAMRAGRGMGSQRLRGFDSFENWRLGVGGSFKDPADAERHRRYVMSVGMQGTGYAANNAPPPIEPPAPPPGGGGAFAGGVQRAQSMALAFGKGMLALAGINSIMGMASHSLDMATEESVGTDTTKRLMGDLGVAFDDLQQKSRQAAQGLGLTYVEAMRLQQQFVRVAGDVRDVNLGAANRGSWGFARRFGIDPSESVQFFGTMQRLHVTSGDEQSMQKLAVLIGATIEKSGYTGKADEIIAAVSDFATGVARASLSAPNVGAYASYMTSLMASKYPGLDPAGAASILSAADSAIRQGGGMGDASMNFAYAALSRHSPGMDVFTAKALMSGGLAATTRSTFGPGTVLGADYARRGLRIPALTEVTNLQKELEFMRQFAGGNSAAFNEMVQNHFKLASPGQAAELANMTDKAISPADWDAMAKRLDKEREGTEGDRTRQSIADLKNELTRVGGALLEPINSIKEMVVRMADVVAPDKTKPPPVGHNDSGSAPDWSKRFGYATGIQDAAQSAHNRLWGKSWQGNVSDGVVGMMYETDRRLGLPEGSTLRQLLKEDGGRLNHGAYNHKSGAMGMAQVMPWTLAAMEKRFGRKLNPYDPIDAVLIHREAMRENLLKFGNYADALRGYNSGWDKTKWNNPETSDYVNSLMASGGSKADAQHIRVVLEGETRIAVKDHTGKTVGHTQLKATAKPTPSGTSGLVIDHGRSGGALMVQQ